MMANSMRAVLAATLASLAATVQAANDPGLYFYRDDWELACDNTRTCRAAGYNSDDRPAVSVLLVRKAGPGEPVTGRLKFGYYGKEDGPGARVQAEGYEAQIRIDGRGQGKVKVGREMAAHLSKRQVAALLRALAKESEIDFEGAGGTWWRLSDKGAAAVLLKMDEFQGRVGTPGALIRKGTRSEQTVLPALPKPVIVVPSLPKTSGTRLSGEEAEALAALLRPITNQDDCETLFRENPENWQMTVTRLTETKSLVSASCWRAAYNEGVGFWVVSEPGRRKPSLVTTSGSTYSDGVVSYSQKDRGLGDCWSRESWTWNGRVFQPSEARATGMCKLVAPGGAWDLPTRVSEIRRR
jgi:hypothetical protein